MRTIALSALIAIHASQVSADITGKQVRSLGRNWVVWASEVYPGLTGARRLNVELLPYRGPAVLKAKQAVRAMRAATGCAVRRDSLFSTISGDYYGQLVCR